MADAVREQRLKPRSNRERLSAVVVATTTALVGDPFIGSVVGGHRITRLLGRGGIDITGARMHEVARVLDIRSGPPDHIIGGLTGGSPTPSPTPTSLRGRGRLQRQLDRLAQTYNRLAIRLGRLAPTTKLMNDAFTTATEINFLLVEGDADRRTGLVTRLNRYTKQTARFVDAAYRVARSTI